MVLKLRPRVDCLSEPQQALLARAFQTLLDSRDPAANYQYWAGIHARCCPHHSELFLPWHRAYIREFERALQRAVADSSLMLPDWDWTITPSIPALFEKPPFPRTARPRARGRDPDRGSHRSCAAAPSIRHVWRFGLPASIQRRMPRVPSFEGSSVGRKADGSGQDGRVRSDLLVPSQFRRFPVARVAAHAHGNPPMPRHAAPGDSRRLDGQRHAGCWFDEARGPTMPHAAWRSTCGAGELTGPRRRSTSSSPRAPTKSN